MYFRLLELPPNNPVEEKVIAKREYALRLLDERLRGNEWLVGREVMVADVRNAV